MKIYSRITYQWNGTEYVEIGQEFDIHNGPVALCCGATGAQNQIEQQQTNFSSQMMNQATEVFGKSSGVFNDLVSSLAPTVAAGPNQQGFSAAESSNLQSQAITNSGQAYKNAKAAVGNAEASQGGGNTQLTSGAKIGVDDSVAESAAENTANQLGQINEANYATGRQNYDTAVGGLENSTNVFNAADSAANAATNASQAASSTANQIATQNNSWVQAVTGALGGIAGGVVSGGMSNLGKGKGFFGGSGG